MSTTDEMQPGGQEAPSAEPHKAAGHPPLRDEKAERVEEILEAKLRKNLAAIKAANYPLVIDKKAEDAVEIMQEIIARKRRETGL